jgi:hypothetical protein
MYGLVVGYIQCDLFIAIFEQSTRNARHYPEDTDWWFSLTFMPFSSKAASGAHPPVRERIMLTPEGFPLVFHESITSFATQFGPFSSMRLITLSVNAPPG